MGNETFLPSVEHYGISGFNCFFFLVTLHDSTFKDYKLQA
jgi:hypothetical protein